MQAEPQSLAANEPPATFRRSFLSRFLSVSVHRTNFLGAFLFIAVSYGSKAIANQLWMVRLFF
jgi:hypothetical protein